MVSEKRLQRLSKQAEGLDKIGKALFLNAETEEDSLKAQFCLGMAEVTKDFVELCRQVKKKA